MADRLYSPEELHLKQVVGESLEKLNQVLVFEQALGSYKLRQGLKLSNQDFQERVRAQRNWVFDRVVRAALYDELVKDKRLGPRIRKAMGELEARLAVKGG